MTIISTDSIRDDVLESLEWDFQHRQISSLAGSVIDQASEYIHEAIDRQMIYTQDILDTWTHYGHQELAHLPLSDFDSISAAITQATYESLRDEVNAYDVVDAWIQTHASLFEGTDVDPEDRDAAISFLEEYSENNFS